MFVSVLACVFVHLRLKFFFSDVRCLLGFFVCVCVDGKTTNLTVFAVELEKNFLKERAKRGDAA